jgi:methylglutaconyl-CoA hydratase
MTFEHLAVRRDGPVERLTLNRPEVRNAFNAAMIAELTAWAALPRPGVRVVVLSGEGPLFCAGADLAWMAGMAEYSRDENLADAHALARMFTALDTLPVPLVGRVHGTALGGGCGLAAVCDIVVAADDTAFAFTEVKLGILPAVIAPFALARIGTSAARELFLTGARFTAARAKEIGLVHAVVPASDLDAAVAGYVRELLTAGPEAVAATKALIRTLAHAAPAEVASLTASAIADRRVSAEGQEGLRAFLERRRASWRADA